MDIIVDTNIIFSAMLNTNSRIGELLLSTNSLEYFDFYSPLYVLEELNKHQLKLQKRLKLKNQDDLQELQFLVLKNINFIDESSIKRKFWRNAAELTKDVDFNDIAFVALALERSALLWTGDKKLKVGLKDKGYEAVIDTAKLKLMVNAEGK